MTTCPNCGRRNEEQAKVCEVCGCPIQLRAPDTSSAKALEADLTGLNESVRRDEMQRAPEPRVTEA